MSTGLSDFIFSVEDSKTALDAFAFCGHMRNGRTAAFPLIERGESRFVRYAASLISGNT
jgi:hypothetical protein